MSDAPNPSPPAKDSQTEDPAALDAATAYRNRLRKEKKRKGLVIVYTGNGKGKTTAAMGMALRAVGHGYPVRMIQFIKGDWKVGETAAIARLAPEWQLSRGGRGFTIEGLRNKRVSDEEHAEAARQSLALASQTVQDADVHMVILDEIMYAIEAGLVSEREVLELVERKAPLLHLVLTGRNAPAAIVAAADLVTEMREVKHPYRDQGVIAQKGVEY